MYGQRRGLASGQFTGDMEARDANANLMRGKRRQQLLVQLQEKEELLKQYTNPRGIGMGGQTVPQRDIDILQQQIDTIRRQLDGGNDAVPAHPTPTQTPQGSNYGGYVGSSGRATPNYQGGGGYTPPSSQIHSSNSNQMANNQYQQQQQQLPSAIPAQQRGAYSQQQARQPTKRDEVWQRKYERWLQKRQNGNAPSSFSQCTTSVGTPQSSSYQSPQSRHNNDYTYGNGDAMYQQQQQNEQYQQQQYQQYNNDQRQPPQPPQLPPQHQQQPQYGRRATPPVGQQRMDYNQSQQSNRSNNNNQYQQQQQQHEPPQHGRRSQQAQHHQPTRLW